MLTSCLVNLLNSTQAILMSSAMSGQACSHVILPDWLDVRHASCTPTSQHLLYVNLTAAWLQMYVCYMQGCQAT